MLDYDDNQFDYELDDEATDINELNEEQEYFVGSEDVDDFEGERTFIDADGDGYKETTIVTYDDINEEGVVRVHEVFADTDGDGIDDYHSQLIELDTDDSGEVDKSMNIVDVDGDGIPDRYEEYLDYDEDGVVDNMKIYTDENLDGKFDTMEKHFDSDGDGVLDAVEVYQDEHMNDPVDDPIYEDDEMYVYDEDGDILIMSEDNVRELEEYMKYVHVMSIEQYDPSSVSDPDMIIGYPDDSMEYWEMQEENGPCALYSQMFVIEELTGEDIDIEEFINEATDNGWYDESRGTMLLNMSKMLDYYDIDQEMNFNMSIDDIAECLEDGGKVIVSVDADQIWFGEETDIFSPEGGPNHAVEVIGIDNSDPDNPMVILNDPGIPTGRGAMVPLDVFENAWNEGDRQMIACYPN